MGRFNHSKKAHSEGKGEKNNKFAIGKTGNKKLDDDFVYILFAIFWTKDLPKKI